MGNINIFMDPRMARFLHQIAGCTPGGGGGGGGTIDTVARADATQALSDAADAQATADAALAAASPADDQALFEGTASEGFITPDGLVWSLGRFNAGYIFDNPGDINTDGWVPGDTALISAGAVGDWTGHDGQIARVHDTGSGYVWIYFIPRPGDIAWVASVEIHYQHRRGVWEPLSNIRFSAVETVANQAASDVADALDTADTALGLATSAYDTANNAFLGKIKFSGQAVADLIEANTDDWDITGFAAASGVRVQSDAAYDITGLMGGEDGRIVFLYNVGTFDLTLKHMSGSSSSGNQFACGGSDKVLPGLGACLLYYGGGVWFVIGL